MRRVVALLVVVVLGLSACAGTTSPQSQPTVLSTPAATPSPTPTQAGLSARPTPRGNLEGLAEEAENAAKLTNGLYEAGVVPAVNCTFPVGDLTARPAVLGYAKAVIACLDTAWEPVVGRARAYFEPPVLYAVKAGGSTACGPFVGDTYTAFYCSRNKAIYFEWAEYIEAERGGRNGSQVGLQYMMAHEYGHHLQQLTGIATFYYFTVKTNAAQLAESRRLELQATCLGFAFLGANQKTLALAGDRRTELRYRESYGDHPGEPRDHGSPESNRLWSRTAFASKSPASCNTWAASAKKVS